MKIFAKKYLILFVAIIAVAAALWLTNGSKKDNASEPQKAQVKSEQVAGDTESTQEEQTPQKETTNPNNQSKTKVQGSQTVGNPTTQNNGSILSTNEAGIPVTDVVVNIKIGSDLYSYKVNWHEGMKVFDALNQAHIQNNFSLKFKDFGPCPDSETPKTCGAFVTEIRSYSCECWVYDRTDKSGNKLPANAASWQKINSEDIITWRST